MSRVAAMFAVVAAAVALLAPMATADPDIPWAVDSVDDTPWQVAFVDFHYDCQSNETVFVYNLTASPEHDLGHWTVSAPNCAGAELADDQEWEDHGVDGVTGLTGFKWAWGQPADSSRVYVLRLVGEHGIAKDGEYAVSGDGKFAIGTVDVVPDCAAATHYPEMDKPVSLVQDCGDELITAFPAGCVDTSCYKLVHTEVEYPVCQAEPHYELTYRLEAETDGFVWASQAVRNVVFNDSTAPTWRDAEPVDATFECDRVDEIPPAAELSAEDNCGIGEGGSTTAVEACEKNTTTHCPHHYYIVRSWTAIDDCGNERCTTQTITVTDTTAPELHGVPDDERLTCAAVQADPSLIEDPVVTANDSCSGDLTDDIEAHKTTIADECTNTFLIRRRWKVVDACGNEDEAHQLVTVYDDVAPVLNYDDSIPKTRTVECKEIPDAEIITAHDECADENTTVTYTQTPEDPESLLCGSACNVLVERFWTTCDDCGNVANLTRHLIVKDRKPPTFDLARESDVTVECNEVPAQRAEPASDVCEGKVADATCTETRENSTCEHEYVLTRVCEVCDCCGNCANRTRVITVIDTNITCPTAPADASYQCNAIPAQAGLTAPAQRCPETLGQDFGERPYTPSCSYDIVRFWTFDDCADNTCTVEQTLSISDNIDPVFDSCPADTSAECHLPEAETLTATDNCSAIVTVTHADVNETNECPGRRLVKRTYTADDGCSNTVDCVQYINVNDTLAPEWVSFPADEALLCSDEVVVVTPTANDDCSETTVIQVSDETVLHGCANNYTRTVTWKAVDQCGNTLGPRSQVIRVTDPDAPVLTEPLPEDKTDYCHDISCPDDVFATDNCDGLDLSYEEERIDFGDSTCDRLYELHRTWTATDDCGQTDTHTQVVTVSDPEAPVYNGGDLEDEEISCEDDIVLPTDPSTNWTDNCGDVTLVSITNTTSNTFECKNNVTVLVVWTVRDECGNTASVNKTYKVYDLTNPDIEDLDDTTFECDEEVVLEDPWHNDTCSNTILTATNVTTSLDCPTTGYLSQTVRNFTATDLCGNVITSSQVTRVTDTVDPTMECPPEVVFGTCCSVPPAAVLTATDNCAATQDVVAVETRQDGSCVNTYNLTYTWTAYDECRNFKQCVQTVVIVDDQDPTLEGVPTTDASAQCEDVPKPEHVCAHDNCGPLSLHFNETRVAGDCSASFTLRREWTAVDACGHDVTEGYDLVVSDENDPYWGALPSDDTRECVRGASDPTFSDPSCTDNCTTTSVTPSSSQVTVGCVADIDFHFGWECVDECSNSITHNITVEQRDTTDPFFTWPSGSAPADASYDCAADEAETPEVGDSCTNAFLAYDNETELDVNASCPIQRSWVRVWNVTDECDHFVVHRQTVSINRPGTPFFTTTVADSTIGCKDAVPAAPVVSAEDTCGNAISPVLVTTIENENCTELLSDPSEYDIVRTWTATDQCGQVVTLVQRISVRDMSPPTVTVPPARTLHNKCEQEPKLTGASHNDDCYSEIDSVDEDLNSGSCPYRFDIKTTFTATDNCGKQTSDSVQETYTFDLAPEVVNRSNISTHRTARCDNVETTPDVIAWVDGCGNDISGGELNTYVIEGDCPNNYTLVWNYSITDDCDLTSYFVIRTHVRDESAPVLHFEWPVQDELVECPFVSPAPEATATDSCGGDVTIEFVEFKVGFDDSDPDLDCCNYDIYRVWKATDACGHSSTKTQKIQVQDTIPPHWTGPDIEDKDIVCPEVVERPNITWFEAPFAHGFCAGETESTNCTDSDAATYQFVLDGETYTLSNARFIKWVNGVAFLTGNATSGSTTYAVDFQFGLGSVSTSEGLAQSINNNTLKASCYEGSDGVVLAQWAFYETLQGNLTDIATGDLLEVSGGSYLQLGLGATGRNELYGLRTTLTATPEGGAAVDGELVLQLNDCNTSDWDLPELECGHELVTTEDETHDEECIGRYTHVFIWNATDPAGNTNSTTMTVTSDDLTPPTFFDLPASTDSGVCAEPPIPEIKAVDECSYANVSDVVNGTKMPFGPAECEYKYTRERTWTAIDDCLNDVDFVQTITVNDNVDPVITLGTKGTNKECFADLEPAATHSCSDNCGDANIASCTASDNTPAVPSNCDVTITYSYNAADDCGNTASEFYMVTVDDVSVPVCQSVGDDKLSCEDEDIRIPCEDGVPAKRNAVFLDNCDGELTVVPERTIVGDCPQVVTDLYEVADSCNNSAISFTKTYIIYNSESPVITTPANRTVGDCTSWEIPAEDENVSATDNCDGDLSVEHTGDTFTHDGDCLVLVTRHWRAVDSCGAITTAASYIIINDTTPPTFEPASIANEVINCTDDVPCPETVTITDGCDGVHLKYKETEVAGRCDNERVLIRTWTATDSCNNAATLSYNITIIDEIDPEWVGDLPVNETIECDEAPAGRTNLNATDSCGPATTVYNETRVDGSCPHEYQLVRTWVATDACDNTIDHSVTIHVNDTEKPTVADLTDKAHECDRTLPEFDVPTFSDNCGAVSVSNTTGTVNNGCNGNFTVTNTWVGTDECGNSESVDQDIVVTDTQAPYFTSTPARVVNETCTNTTEPFPTFADDCSELAEITESSTDVIVPLDKLCAWPYRIDRSWTITDDCDHSATVFQTVNVVDSDFPSFTWEDDFAPEDAVVECDTVVPWTPVTASDPCEGDLTASITNTSTGTPDACDWTETRFWEVCDCSGNCVNHTQTIQYVDNEAPVFDAVPEAGPFTCGETIVLPNATANDPQCTGEAFVVVPTQSVSAGACAWNYTITATYFVEDRCGNNVTTTKDFKHEDKTPPVPDPVFNVTIQCDEPVPEEIITCVDACDGEISSISISERVVQEGINGCDNGKIIEQTYTCTDQCENSASSVRYVHIEDTEAPQWTDVPQPDRDYQCDEDLPELAPSADDNCGGVTIERLTDTVVEGSCDGNYTVTHHWLATDSCSGLTNTTSQTFQVIDTTDPTLENCPSNIEAECDAVPCPADVTARDTCPGITLDYKQERENGACEHNYTLTRTWTATDACGNDVECSHTVEVTDSVAPTFTGTLPVDTNYTCEEDVPAQGDLPYTDNCSNVTYSKDESTEETGCAQQKITRTWTITDECNNTFTHTQIIFVIDELPPVPEQDTCVCNEPVYEAAYAHYAAPTGLVSFGPDACGDASQTVTVDSCVSDQDAELELDDNDGFTADCHVMDGVLKVRLRASHLHEDGRLYNVTFKAVDGCGNAAYAQHYFWVPLDHESNFTRGFPAVAEDDNVDIGSCVDSCIEVTPPEFCAECPCKYAVDTCVPDGSVSDVDVSMASRSHNSTTDETHIVYNVTASAGGINLDRLLIGVDAAANGIEVVAVLAGASRDSPAVVNYWIGELEASFLSGLVIDTDIFTAGTTQVSVILRGNYAASESVPTEISNAGLLCGRGMTTSVGARIEDGNDVCGHIGVYGTVLDGHHYDESRVDLSGVTVALADDGAVVATTVTDGEGNFCFRDIADGNYTVYPANSGYMVSDGAAHDQSGEYLVADIAVDSAFPHGDPQEVTVSGADTDGLEFVLYLNNIHFVSGLPVYYADGSTDYFKGTSRSVGFWVEQLKAVAEADASEHCPRRAFLDLNAVRAYAATADSLLSADCGFSGADAVAKLLDGLDAGDAKSKLTAVILNHVSGHGLLEPYRNLQGIVARYAANDLCNGGVDPTVEGLLDEILGAM